VAARFKRVLASAAHREQINAIGAR